MNNLYIIISILLVFFIFKIFILRKKIKSKIDGRYYSVETEEVADTLARININVLKLLDFLKIKSDNEFSLNTRLLISRYNPDNLSENLDLTNTSYTIDKGSNVALCITTRNKNKEIYDINTLMFVVIHELAHIGSESYGHNEEFFSFFRFLIKKCIELGIYEYSNYNKTPVEYCGVMIDKTVL